MPYPIVQDAAGIDLGSRFYTSSTVVGSPAGASETLVAQITGIDTQLPASKGTFLSAALSFTVGTNGTAVRVRIRQGTTAGAGTVVADTGALTGGIAAANLVSQDIQNLDAPVAGAAAVASYHVSLTVTGGSAASTVSQANIVALVV